MDELILHTRAENLEAVKQILNCNSDLDLNEAVNGRKVLAYALEAEDTGIMEVLLATGRIDVNDWIVSFKRPPGRKQVHFCFMPFEDNSLKISTTTSALLYALSQKNSAKN